MDANRVHATSSTGQPQTQNPTQTHHGNGMEMAVRSVLASGTYYECLKVEEKASRGQIRKSYMEVLLKVHPDKSKIELDQRQKEEARTAFMKVKTAMEVLVDDKLRSAYDRKLASERVKVVAASDRQQPNVAGASERARDAAAEAARAGPADRAKARDAVRATGGYSQLLKEAVDRRNADKKEAYARAEREARKRARFF